MSNKNLEISRISDLLTVVPKKSVSTSVDKELFLRIDAIRRVDRRSQASVVAWAIEKGLPLLEKELEERLSKAQILNEPVKSQPQQRKPKGSYY